MLRVSTRSATLASALALATLASLSVAHADGQRFPGGQPHVPGAQQHPGPQQQAGMMEMFRQTLQQFGTFQQHQRYGEVWVPNPQVTGQGWRPYPECHWTYDRQQNQWFFNDQTPWGQIVHHHGRWANDPQLGWVWVAGEEFGPGWVAWRNDAQSISWAALPPEQDGQEPAQEAWHTQDLATFNASCRGGAPGPVAAPQPAAPAYAPAAPAYAPAAPAYAPPIPVYAPPAPVYTPGVVVRPPPVVVIPGHRPPFCYRFPLHPACRVGGGIGGGFCFRFPLHPACRIGGGIGGRFCVRFPHHPSCRLAGGGVPWFCRGVAGPSRDPRCRLTGGRQVPLHCRGVVGPGSDPRCRLQRPFHRPNFARPNLRPNHLRPNLRPNFARPNFRPNFARPNFRPNHLRPNLRPNFARPNFRPNHVRPGPSFRPNFGRPNFGRPAFARPAFSRPAFAGRPHAAAFRRR